MELFGMKTSKRELIDLLKSWLAISLALAIVMGLKADSLVFTLLRALFLVGTAFLAHEIAHKYVAQKYHCWAEYRSDDRMLVMALLISLLRVLFAAPGAVMIYGWVDKKKNGKISLAGPVTNLVIAGLFLGLLFAGMYPGITGLAFVINSWIGVFNLVPFLNFDGAKIYAWSKPAYFITLSVGIIFLFIQQVLFQQIL
jgi:Zn-dependent protease